jgi:uncharacterized protein involved in exopolysaccharide biosynthesis
METVKELLRKKIELANLKRNKGKLAEVIKLENEIVELRRMINQELNKITKEEKPTIDIQE